ncbi:ABC transporter permease [Bifidobacterium avesanii]|uniref:ABC transporter permease n=1 Tax=Bifidobacterium avesanii TaxID=1798157 RepID=A0A7K3TEE6_9BIFI|nr:ABC transporter permease [Bifidobacterium avesanii]KAB8295455.1 multidrug permease ABC transporter [Bifidobacterium avesanii]NEG77461.1 ABC transporter permease [Bifidobacterium avesanii]
MNTCKATLRVLAAHRLYLIIYLLLIGILMFSMSWSMLSASASSASVSTTYEPERPTVAVVDRDANRGGVASGLRDYLSPSSDLTDLPDEPETLQQAVASNWADLIVIIPDGFAQGLLDAAESGDEGAAPSVETVTSYTSGAGSMAGMAVNGFLTLTRTALVGSLVEVDVPEQVIDGIRAGLDDPDAATDRVPEEPSGDALAAMPKDAVRAPSLDDLAKAVGRTVDAAHDGDVNHEVAVEDVSSAASAAGAASAEVVADGFGGTMKTALYPLFLAMSVCTSIILGAFTAGEVRRRLTVSPRRASAMGLQRVATLCGFALAVCAGYFAVAVALTLAAGLDAGRLNAAGMAMTFCSTCVYALMTVACGFMLSEFGASETAANGFANIVGLVILFTSGISVPLDIMPAPMLTLAKVLPGWWYCTAIDNALGIGSAAATGASAVGWLGALGLVALFAVAFVSVGLAAGRMRRSRPAAAVATVAG